MIQALITWSPQAMHSVETKIIPPFDIMKHYSLITLAIFAMAATNAQSATIVPVGNSSFETVGTQTGGWYALPGSGDWVTSISNPFQILDTSITNNHFNTSAARA